MTPSSTCDPAWELAGGASTSALFCLRMHFALWLCSQTRLGRCSEEKPQEDFARNAVIAL